MPVIAQETPGLYVTSALWNASVKAMGDYLMGSGSNGVPRFRGYQASAQSLSDNTWAAITLDAEDFDSDGGHSTTTNPSRYVCQVAGTYLAIGTVGFVAGTVGNRAVRFLVNGSPIRGSFNKLQSASNTHSSGITAVSQLVLGVGDYVEVQGLQTSGGALNTNVATDVDSCLGLQWISG
ncbi:hypothetical protein ACIP98_20870 [Streptomyces sp. NPDC088354]|uniref:hypothetical protein n=1 Tax=Streptomyces sp. NPDC088354 TaxID=3365856 RepID=UPI003807FF3B